MFLDNFIFDFDKAFYKFNRPIKDMYPYQIKKHDNKTNIVHNVIGLSKKDVTVDIEVIGSISYLVIKGEKKNTELDVDYKVASRFVINPDLIDKIEYEVENGLLIIDIIHKKPIKPNIDIISK